MSVQERVRIRLQNEPGAENETLLTELCDLAASRICLRVREQTLPALLESIAADAVIKIWRRWTYEGIASENKGTISTSFVEDILAEYGAEFDAYRESRVSASGGRRIRFL